MLQVPARIWTVFEVERFEGILEQEEVEKCKHNGR